MDGGVGDSSADETNNLVLSEDHSSPSRAKKYMVSGGVPSKKKWFSRNEWICMAVGVVVVVMGLMVVLGLGVGLGLRNSGNASNSGSSPWRNVRLPSAITPEDYTIHLTVDTTHFSVTGSSTINLNIHQKTSYLLIHTKEMNISEFGVAQNGEKIVAERNFTYEENNFYVIILASSLSVGMATLEMKFDYPLVDGLMGFYRSSYQDSSGETHWIATTHFEPTDARKAFPCFDEPAMKANYTICITHSSDLKAHSNMPIISEKTSEDGFTETLFQTSVEMSSYLVAFVVSDFDCITEEADTVFRVNVSVCSNREVLNHTHYALEKASEILKFYETYFNVPYPLPKQDLFAIPDFSAGAMENWGLITYREAALLYNPATNPETSKEKVATVIAHELAHQWFGNLVTMEWWDGVWLNEGFATFTQYIGTDATEPSFHMPEEFQIQDMFRALSADRVNESHPVIQTVSDPDEINELFDTISYSKGGSVLRMIREVLTPEKFQEGISRYLEKSKYGNARTQQLWDALQTVVEDSSLNVTEIMDTWTLQMGYPVLHVNTESGHVTQERFFALKPNGTIAPSPYNYVWLVPFSYLTERNSSQEFVNKNFRIIRRREERLTFPENSGFIKVNVNQTGFYRVNYDLSNWYDIIAHLRSNRNSVVLSAADKAGLLDDAFALSRNSGAPLIAGLLDMRVALNLSQFVGEETEYVPCITALSHLASMGSRLILTPVYGLFQEFVRNLTSGLAERYTFNRTDLTHLQIFMRTSVLNSAWANGNSDVIDKALQLFQNWMRLNQTVDADLKAVVYPVGIAFGGVEEWDFVWQRYLTSSDPYEKKLYLSALAKTRVPWLLIRYLEYAVDPSKVRTQDTSSVISYVSTNVYGRYITWNFVRNNWNLILKRYGRESFTFLHLIKDGAGHFSTELELHEVERFFQQQEDHGSVERTVQHTLETIRINIFWLQTNQDLISSCLSDTQSCFSPSPS